MIQETIEQLEKTISMLKSLQVDKVDKPIIYPEDRYLEDHDHKDTCNCK